ncbi:MAG: hypothetical protein D6748_15255 [Calditrichaeota bacterium]|nr:MAG: hypothetical protein D6748_15255 [Calditrichota bacterium]
MQLKPLRPKFIIETEVSGEEIQENLRQLLNDPGAPCVGTIANHYVILSIPEKDSHFWSPRLTLDFHSEKGKTRIVGLFGPRPMVWTLFAGFYLAAIFLGFVGLMWGGAQWSLGMPAHALWLVAISLVALIIAYTSALIGQKLGEEQMHVLKEFFDKSLPTA